MVVMEMVQRSWSDMTASGLEWGFAAEWDPASPPVSFCLCWVTISFNLEWSGAVLEDLEVELLGRACVTPTQHWVIIIIVLLTSASPWISSTSLGKRKASEGQIVFWTQLGLGVLSKRIPAMPTPPCQLPHLGGQKGKDALILAVFIFHFAASTLRIQGVSHLLITVRGMAFFFCFVFLLLYLFALQLVIWMCWQLGKKIHNLWEWNFPA